MNERRLQYHKTKSQQTLCMEPESDRFGGEIMFGIFHTRKLYGKSLTTYSTKSSERLLSKKSYAADMAFISDREDVVTSQNLGWRLENVVLLELYRRINIEYQQIYYMRKTNDFEVDFLIYESSQVLELIQVTYALDKMNKKLYRREVGGLIKAAQQTKCNHLTIICLEGITETLQIDDYKIEIIKAVEWLCKPHYYVK